MCRYSYHYYSECKHSELHLHSFCHKAADIVSHIGRQASLFTTSPGNSTRDGSYDEQSSASGSNPADLETFNNTPRSESYKSSSDSITGIHSQSSLRNKHQIAAHSQQYHNNSTRFGDPYDWTSSPTSTHDMMIARGNDRSRRVKVHQEPSAHLSQARSAHTLPFGSRRSPSRQPLSEQRSSVRQLNRDRLALDGQQIINKDSIDNLEAEIDTLKRDVRRMRALRSIPPVSGDPKSMAPSSEKIGQPTEPEGHGESPAVTLRKRHEQAERVQHKLENWSGTEKPGHDGRARPLQAFHSELPTYHESQRQPQDHPPITARKPSYAQILSKGQPFGVLHRPKKSDSIRVLRSRCASNVSSDATVVNSSPSTSSDHDFEGPDSWSPLGRQRTHDQDHVHERIEDQSLKHESNRLRSDLENMQQIAKPPTCWTSTKTYGPELKSSPNVSFHPRSGNVPTLAPDLHIRDRRRRRQLPDAWTSKASKVPAATEGRSGKQYLASSPTKVTEDLSQSLSKRPLTSPKKNNHYLEPTNASKQKSVSPASSPRSIKIPSPSKQRTLMTASTRDKRSNRVADQQDGVGNTMAHPDFGSRATGFETISGRDASHQKPPGCGVDGRHQESARIMHPVLSDGRTSSDRHHMSAAEDARASRHNDIVRHDRAASGSKTLGKVHSHNDSGSMSPSKIPRSLHWLDAPQKASEIVESTTAHLSRAISNGRHGLERVDSPLSYTSTRSSLSRTPTLSTLDDVFIDETINHCYAGVSREILHDYTTRSTDDISGQERIQLAVDPVSQDAASRPSSVPPTQSQGSRKHIHDKGVSPFSERTIEIMNRDVAPDRPSSVHKSTYDDSEHTDSGREQYLHDVLGHAVDKMFETLGISARSDSLDKYKEHIGTLVATLVKEFYEAKTCDNQNRAQYLGTSSATEDMDNHTRKDSMSLPSMFGSAPNCVTPGLDEEQPRRDHQSRQSSAAPRPESASATIRKYSSLRADAPEFLPNATGRHSVRRFGIGEPSSPPRAFTDYYTDAEWQSLNTDERVAVHIARFEQGLIKRWRDGRIVYNQVPGQFPPEPLLDPQGNIIKKKPYQWSARRSTGSPVKMSRAPAPSPSDSTSPSISPAAKSDPPIAGWTMSSALPGWKSQWKGGDGKEIAFVGNSTDAEMDPSQSVNYHSVNGMQQLLETPSFNSGFPTHRSFAGRSGLTPFAPKKRRTWAARRRYPFVPCGDMEIVSAIEHMSYLPQSAFNNCNTCVPDTPFPMVL